MGVSQSSIANKLRLLNLAPEVQDAFLQEKISERHARSLLVLPKEEQAKWLQKILAKRLTVRQLDLEIKKAKGEVNEDVPLVNISPDVNKIISNASDINQKGLTKEDKNMEIEQKDNISEIKPEEPKSIPNKFFNFLEDEAANMQMIETPSPIQKESTSMDEIEVLDDLGSSSTPEPATQQPQEETIMPFLFSNSQVPENNKIEEIKETSTEKIVDPMDSVIKLDPNYKQMVEEEKGIDLKTAINEVRDLIEKMQKQGFQISLDEIDLNGNYQMTITIKEND